MPASAAVGKSLSQVSANLQFPDVSTSNLVIISFFLFTCLSRHSSFGWGWHLPQCLMSVFHSPVPGPRLVFKPFSSYFSVSSLNNVTSSPALRSKKLKLFQFLLSWGQPVPLGQGNFELFACLFFKMELLLRWTLRLYFFIYLFTCISVQLASKAECFAFHCNKLLAVCLWFGCGTQKIHFMWWEVARLQRVLMNIYLKWHKSVCRKVVFISFICLHCLNYLICHQWLFFWAFC